MAKMREKLRHLREEIGPMVRLAAPIVMAEIGWVAMGIVDTMMVGRLPNGTEAIGAVSMGSVLFYVIGIFGGGMLLGLDTLVSQSFGAGQVDDCHRSLLNAIYFLLALTPLLMLVVWLSVPVLRVVGVAPGVLELTVPYLGALLWSAPPLMLYFAFRRYLQAMNLVLPVALAMISANLVNAFANWVLIYGKLGAPAMGVVGAGWATCISRAYTAVFLLLAIFYYEHKHQMGLRAVAFKPDLARIARLIQLGFPAAMHITLEVGVFAAATALAGRLGAVPLAAHQVALQTASLTFMVPLGMASAAAVRVGQAIGRRDAQGASRAGWTAIALGASFMSVSALCFVLFPRGIIRLYTPDETVIATGVLLLTIAAFFQLFDGIQGVSIGALRGAGDTRTPMLAHLIADWGVGLPVGYYLCFMRDWGAAGLWVGLSTAMILAGIVLLTVWKRHARRFVDALSPRQ